MKWCRFLLIVTAAGLAVPAPAGIFFNRHPKVDPAARVSALVMAVKTEQSDHKRAKAAEDLRAFDASAFPQIVPTLADVAVHDSSASVRIEAVQSLGRIRPISQQAGSALEQVRDHDSNLRVRWQARSSLWQYHLSGYHESETEQPVKPFRTPVPNTVPNTAPNGEPPLAAPESEPVSVQPARPFIRPVPAPPADVTPVPVNPVEAVPVARPLPSGPAQLEVVPVDPPLLQPMPTTSGTDGPELQSPE
jgi:hypothetical protein